MTAALAESRELLGPPLGVLHHRLDRLGPDAALSPGDDGLPAQRCVGQLDYPERQVGVGLYCRAGRHAQTLGPSAASSSSVC